MSTAADRFEQSGRRQFLAHGRTDVRSGELLRHPVYTRVLHWSVAAFFILALLTVFSIAPPLLLAWACEFSSGCIVGGFWKFMIGPGGVRTQALVMVLAAIVILLSYVLVLLNFQKHKDVLDRGSRHFG